MRINATNSTSNTPTRYLDLLDELNTSELPMALVRDRAITMSFSFDAVHDWIGFESLAAELDDESDLELLISETFGGRLSRPAIAVSRLQHAAQVPGLVASPAAWGKMVVNAAECIAQHDLRRSFQTFADLVDVVLDALQPCDMDLDETWVEVVKLDDLGVAQAATVDWKHAYFENFMQDAGGDVQRVDFSYPGSGCTARLLFVFDDKVETYTLTVPATEGVAELVDHHYEFHDALHPTPVMDMLNALSEYEVNALLELANRADIDITDSVCVGAVPSPRS